MVGHRRRGPINLFAGTPPPHPPGAVLEGDIVPLEVEAEDRYDWVRHDFLLCVVII